MLEHYTGHYNPTIPMTAFTMAQRYIGTKEVKGNFHSADIMSMLTRDVKWPTGDEVPWCSAFANHVCWLLRLPRSKSLRARSWLLVGHSISLDVAMAAFDVVILKRGSGKQPGPEVIKAPGHVGFFAGVEGSKVLILGGNQSNEVNVSRYPVSRVLGVRRLM